MPPGQPRDVTANKTCKEITLMWKHPFDNGGMEITNYIITVRTVLSQDKQPHTENVGGSILKHKIVYEFKPKTGYELRINARNDAGPGEEVQLSEETDEFCEYLFPYL